MKKTAFLMLLIGLAPLGFAAELEVVNFARHGLSLFTEKSFSGHTQYQLVEVDGGTVLRAKTANSASALFRQFDIDLDKTPYLNWRWRVDNIFPISNQQSKQGDDYPARVYVVVKEGLFPWQTKALNYVWSNQPAEQRFWPNPFTGKAVMIPQRSAADPTGVWFSERVNIVEDFYRVFGRRIDKAHGVAIMSDSDNAGGAAVAYYGNITLSD